VNERPLKFSYLTAGAAGMYCGSCMHDNTLARALIELGHDVQLIPLYTPIRTDEQDVSEHRVFFGGINVFLKQKYRLFRRLPQWATHWLDTPALIRFAAGLGIETKASQLGALTVTMLRGNENFQRQETARLAEWLQADGPPDVIVFSNMLTAGCVPDVKSRLSAPVVVTLQGDDIFLQDLVEPYRQQALEQIRRLDPAIDGYLVQSRFYADHMAEYLGHARDKFHIVPLGLDTSDFAPERTILDHTNDQLQRTEPPPMAPRPPTIGYLARLAPEKGLHVLARGFLALREMPGMQNARLRIAGWLGPQHRRYVQDVFDQLDEAGARDAWEYVGEVDRRGKVDFLRSLDVLAVPTVYREPKGLFVLEALAAGVPVVQPNHGSFPETLADLGGGLLHRPEDPKDLAERLHELLSDRQRLRELAAAGQQSVHARRSSRAMAEQTVAVLRRFILQTNDVTSASAKK
jgi:glycosyltransferase involved in cell wall biosynthesis